MMDDKEFSACADAMLAHIENLLDECIADFDHERLPGGVIELDFEQSGGSKIIINRHAAAQEIWLAAKSGGYHFRPEPGHPLVWRDGRDGLELIERLQRCMSEQAGVPVALV